ncbi:MAG: hypothetical protein WC565_02830 [Parcubacteria group bacterium]
MLKLIGLPSYLRKQYSLGKKVLANLSDDGEKLLITNEKHELVGISVGNLTGRLRERNIRVFCERDGEKCSVCGGDLPYGDTVCRNNHKIGKDYPCRKLFGDHWANLFLEME